MDRLHRHAYSARPVLAAGLVVLAFVVVLVLRIGPVVVVLSPAHGLHSGDAIGILAAVAACWVLRLGSPPQATTQTV